MLWFGDISNTLRALRVHLFGKGIMTLAVLAAGAVASATGFSAILPIVAVGGFVLTTVNRLYNQRLYENGMLNMYRDDISQQLGIAPEEVTLSQLKEAGKTNDVIGHALTRQRNKTILAVGTAALSAAGTWALVGMFGGESSLKTGVGALLQNIPGGASIAAFANYVSIGVVAGFSGLLFNGVLKNGVSATTSIGKAAAHDRIMEMEWTLKRGLGVSKEQVYGVLVAGDVRLQQAIARQFHKPYSQMRPIQQATVLQRVGVASEMQTIADQINHGEMRPGGLAYLMQGAQNAAHTPQALSAAMAPAPAQSNFVERLGVAPRNQQSYRAQIDAQRTAMIEQGATR